MSLKQECIDMVKLILEPIMEDETDIYDLDTDLHEKFCLETGEDQYGMNCCDCLNYNKGGKCDKEISEKVDILLFSTAHMEGETKYFVFNRKPKHPKLREKINYIYNRKQLIEVMAAYRKEVDYFKDGYAEYARRLEEYKQHADNFCNQIVKDFSIFDIVDPNMIPIVFYDSYREDHDYESKEVVVGDFGTCRKQSVIRIYSSWDNDIEDVKQRIRHEVIHYLLWCIGLPNGDDTGIFHYLCHLYDAGAYKELKDENNGMLLKKLEMDTMEENNASLAEFLYDADKEAKAI